MAGSTHAAGFVEQRNLDRCGLAPQYSESCLPAKVNAGDGYPPGVCRFRHRVRGSGRAFALDEARAMTKGGVPMNAYERPTLTKLGSFKKLTGIGGTGPKDALTKKQSL
jgi:hypothetical protein